MLHISTTRQLVCRRASHMSWSPLIARAHRLRPCFWRGHLVVSPLPLPTVRLLPRRGPSVFSRCAVRRSSFLLRIDCGVACRPPHLSPSRRSTVEPPRDSNWLASGPGVDSATARRFPVKLCGWALLLPPKATSCSPRSLLSACLAVPGGSRGPFAVPHTSISRVPIPPPSPCSCPFSIFFLPPLAFLHVSSLSHFLSPCSTQASAFFSHSLRDPPAYRQRRRYHAA